MTTPTTGGAVAWWDEATSQWKLVPGGLKGDRGPQGERGLQGPQGAPGSDGHDGAAFVPSRSALEDILYDKAYSWELVPGSDVMATTVGVLPKIGTVSGQDVYAGLVTWDGTGSASGAGWYLQDAALPLVADTLYSADALDNGPGLYLGVLYNPLDAPPPYAFPEGWTPGNTTGSGPVLPYLGVDGSYDYYAGLVTVEGTEPFSNAAWALVPADTALTVSGLNGAIHVDYGDGESRPYPSVLPGLYLGWAYTAAGDPAPTALPEGWTFRPYGLGPIAITDENAGGLIGDVAHVVSGWVYNPGPAFGLDDPHYLGVLPASATVAVQVGDIFQNAENSNAMYVVSAAGDVLTNVLGNPASGSTAVYGAASPYSPYWPYIERFDLAAKKWLPRVPMPKVADEVPAHQYGTRATAPGVASVLATGPVVGWYAQDTGVELTDADYADGEHLVQMFQPLPDPGTADGAITGYLIVPDGQDITSDAVDPANILRLRDSGGGVSTAIVHSTWRGRIWAVQNPEDYAQRGAALPPSAGLTWLRARAAVPAKVYAAEGGIAGVIGGKLYFGGGDGDNITGQEFFVYDPADDDSITRLADIPNNNPDTDLPDYSPYGTVGGRLYYGGYFHNCFYDPTTDEWTLSGGDLLPSHVGDQVQGFEIDGKLWFVYSYGGAAFVFDPTTLTVEAKATGGPEGSPYLIDGKMHTFALHRNPEIPDATYDPVADAWTTRTDIAVRAGEGAPTEFVGVTYDGTPYALSAVYDSADQNGVGVYGMTGVRPDKPQVQRFDEADDARTIIAALTQRALHPAGDVAWTPMTLLGSWVNFGVFRGAPRFRKDATGMVHLAGAIKNGDGFFATLPVGYRPEAWIDMTAVLLGGEATSTVVTIRSDGIMAVNDPGAEVGLILDGISFYAPDA